LDLKGQTARGVIHLFLERKGEGPFYDMGKKREEEGKNRVLSLEEGLAIVLRRPQFCLMRGKRGEESAVAEGGPK